MVYFGPVAVHGCGRSNVKIVVCLKYVPDAQADRRFSPDGTVDRAGVDGLLSELDEGRSGNGSSA